MRTAALLSITALVPAAAAQRDPVWFREPAADINGDSTSNTLDVLAFLNLWVAGC